MVLCWERLDFEKHLELFKEGDMEAEAGREEDPGRGLGRAPKDGQGESRREQDIFLQGLYGRGLYHWYSFYCDNPTGIQKQKKDTPAPIFSHDNHER